MNKEKPAPKTSSALYPAREEAVTPARRASPRAEKEAGEEFIFPAPAVMDGEEPPASDSGETAKGEETPAPPAPVARRSPFRQVSRLNVESLENPFRSAQPSPIHWAVGWADLMMTMFVLFLVMYLYPTAKLAQFPPTEQELQAGGTSDGRADTASQPTTKLFDLAQLAKDDEEFARFAEINLSPDNTVRIILAGDLLFPSAKATLNPAAKENIRKMSAMLHENPYRINVMGHTDNQPITGGAFASNWELSVMRATSVARFLIEELGIPASRITASGQSYYHPQVNNDTPANRAKNRRVEIILSEEPAAAVPLSNSTLLPKPGER